MSGFDAEPLGDSERRELQSRLELWRLIGASPIASSMDLQLVARAHGTTIRLRRLDRRQLGGVLFISVAGGGAWLANAAVDIADDLGTEYKLVMTEASGSGVQARGQIWFAPAVPRGARILGLRIAGSRDVASPPSANENALTELEWEFQIAFVPSSAEPKG